MSTPSRRPYLSDARSRLTQDIRAVNERGEEQNASIPAERALTVYVDKRELVTLMTLGAHPEWLVLGYLRNQHLVASLDEIDSITVDWEVGAAAVKTRGGIKHIEERTAKRVVTTGCGQGSVFGDLMANVDQIRLGDAQIFTTEVEFAPGCLTCQMTRTAPEPRLSLEPRTDSLPTVEPKPRSA